MLDGWMWAMASRPIFDDDVGPLDSAGETSRFQPFQQTYAPGVGRRGPFLPVSFLRTERTDGVSQRFARSGVGHGYFQSRFVRSLCLGGGSEKESQQQKSIWFHAFRVRPL